MLRWGLRGCHSRPQGGPGADAGGRASILTPGGHVRIFAKQGRHSTVVRRADAATGRTLRSLTLSGHRFGVPYVSYAPQTGGFTPDGRMLILAGLHPFPPGQKDSDVAVLDGWTLALRGPIHLEGAFLECISK